MILLSILVGNEKEGTGVTFDCWLTSYLKTYAIWDPAGRKSGVSSRIKKEIKVAIKQAEGLLSSQQLMVLSSTWFRWVWEPGDSGNVSTATKADEAKVDLSLWNVGGDGPGMEVAHATIRNWLHSFWRQSMTKEAACWLRTHGGLHSPE
jgi:hypothetical protein